MEYDYQMRLLKLSRRDGEMTYAQDDDYKNGRHGYIVYGRAHGMRMMTSTGRMESEQMLEEVSPSGIAKTDW